MTQENSLMYWYPKLHGTETLTPQTIIVELKNKEQLLEVCDGNFKVLESQWEEILAATKRIGFPLFMRTDEFSGKHNWKNTCFVEKEEDLRQHIATLVEESYMAHILGLPLRALVFRKYIPMKNLFKAFHGEMPVNPEVRFFFKDKKVQCWHWYWIEDAIEQGTRSGLPDNWKEIITNEKKGLSEQEINELTRQVNKVAQNFKGYWSIDFCKSAKGEWILIDMALGEKSWHPEHKEQPPSAAEDKNEVG
jgi:hypothetical protein